MRSKYKPPVLNWILIKFHKYEYLLSTKIFTEISKLSIKRIMIHEKCSIYLQKLFFYNHKKIKWIQFFKNNDFGFFFLEHLSFFFLPFEIIYQFNNLIFFTFFNYFNYLCVKQLSKWPTTDIGLKWYFPVSIDWNQPMNSEFLQNLLFKNFGNEFIGSLGSMIRFFNIFVLNSYFTFFLVNAYKTFPYLSLMQRKWLFYNELFIWLCFFHNPFEKRIILINKCVSIQWGISKWTKFFVSRYYTTSVSTQMIWPKISLFFKTFFKTLDFNKSILLDNILDTENIDELEIPPKFGIYLWNRHLTIIPSCIGKLFYIHTGDWFTPLRITPSMVGHKFGEFSFTRKILLKSSKKKRK